MGHLFDILKRFFQGIQGSYAFNLFSKAFVRLRTAVMHPFRRIVRKVQQVFNVSLISARLVTPITAKVRKILNGEARSPEDYFTVGRFWVSKALVYILILAGCAGVFIYFSWISPPVSHTTTTENLITTVYYDYDDMKLGEYTGKANIRAAGGDVVYTGDIVAGVCTGIGTLWNQDGVLVYQGAFANNRFEGNGTRYYSNGKVMYAGDFVENQFSGEGVLYYDDGTVQYEGEFDNGAYHGKGALYNEKGVMVYEGEFQSGTYHGEGIAYYDSGIKKYEGEFYMGRAQGQGIYYSSAGKTMFQGAFARDDIHYEALLGCTLKDVIAMFKESPIVYFSDGGTSFLFERAQVILKADCLVELKIRQNTAESGSGDAWYLPDEEGDTLTEITENQTEEESTDSTDKEKTEEEKMKEELAALPVNNKFNIYYYLATDEWQSEDKLDTSAIMITGVSTYRSGFDIGFLEGKDMIPENGAPSLQECVAVERVRLSEPTAFSTINYELTTMNRTHIAVSGINLAEAIYEEVYEVDGIRYRLCYPMDKPEQLLFVTVENV